MNKALLTLQMPSPPDPVPVVIDPATTALLVFDVIEHICARQPKCREELVPALASLLKRSRRAGVATAYISAAEGDQHAHGLHRPLDADADVLDRQQPRRRSGQGRAAGLTLC